MSLSERLIWTDASERDSVENNMSYRNSFKQTAQTLMRRRIMRRLIWVYTVCQALFEDSCEAAVGVFVMAGVLDDFLLMMSYPILTSILVVFVDNPVLC
ncbi:hypothetical protein DPMN_091814 [Dreissena polymorpha]|uniref:Uncharacterized protein n=1 Tax=Dreissena polymorpha TaxID=45954 RepID=A0A9D4L173_DREPO|nr:hypothetical protein DPMN_091814 [Dreissena polymorpha]